MVRDSVRSVSPSSSSHFTSKECNGGVEPWSLVTKGKTLVTKGKTLVTKGKTLVTLGNYLGEKRETLGE